MLGTTPTMLGTTPTMLGTTPTMLGTTHTMLGATPTMLGTTPTMLGTTPTMLGTYYDRVAGTHPGPTAFQSLRPRPWRTPLRTAHNRDPQPTQRIPSSLGTQPPKVGTYLSRYSGGWVLREIGT